MFQIIHVIKALSNHQLTILQFCSALKAYNLSNEQNCIKIGFYFINYDKFRQLLN